MSEDKHSGGDEERLRAARRSAADMMRLFDENLTEMKQGLGTAPAPHDNSSTAGEDEEDSEDERTRIMMERRRQKTSNAKRIGLPMGALMDTDDEEELEEDDSGDGDVGSNDDTNANGHGGAGRFRGQQPSAADEANDGELAGRHSPIQGARNAQGRGHATASPQQQPHRRVKAVNKDAHALSQSGPSLTLPSASSTTPKTTSLDRSPGAAKAVRADPFAPQAGGSTQATKKQAGQKRLTMSPPKGPKGKPKSAQHKQQQQQQQQRKGTGKQGATAKGEWNPFANLSQDQATREASKNKRLSSQQARDIEAARRRAFEASLQFERTVSRDKARERRKREEERRKREEEERQRREEEERQRRRAAEENRRREEAFKRREEARRARMGKADPFAPDVFAAGGRRGDKPAPPSTSDKRKKLVKRRSSVALLPFSLPQQEDEIAPYDSDEDVRDAEAAVAQLAQELRRTFAPVLYTGQAYDPNDPVEQYARLLREAREHAAKQRKQSASSTSTPGVGSPPPPATAVQSTAASAAVAAPQRNGSVAGAENDTVDLFANMRDRISSPSTEEETRVEAGMQRLEQQLRLLPRILQRALEECGGDDDEQIESIKARVQEIRNKYKAKLEESNERLQRLGGMPHDLSDLDFGDRDTTATADSGDRAGTAVKSAARFINMGGEDDHDENFNILSSMGLLSTRTANPFADATDTEAATAAATAAAHNADMQDLWGTARGARAGSDMERDEEGVQDPAKRLSALLDELDRLHTDTAVTLTDRQEWTTHPDGPTFSDYELTFESDESCFPSARSVVRRTYDEMRWLVDQLTQEMGTLPPSLPQLPPSTAEDNDFSAFFTAMAQDEEAQASDALLRFFFKPDEPVAPDILPATFKPDLDEVDREDLAALPLSYLRAIAGAIDASTRGCVTRFEFADRILAKHAGLDEEEAVPLASEETEEAGQGFKGVQKVEEELFDSLATTRASDNNTTATTTTATASASASASASADRVSSPSKKEAKASKRAAGAKAKGTSRPSKTAGEAAGASGGSTGPATEATKGAHSGAAAASTTSTEQAAAKEGHKETAQAGKGSKTVEGTKQQHAEATPVSATSPSSVLWKVDEDGSLLLPVSVPAFLSALGLHKHERLFMEAGFDDLRVVVCMKAQELEELGVTDAGEVAAVLRAGMDWQTRAASALLLDNWKRTQHRAKGEGLIPLTLQDQGAAEAKKKQIANAASASGPARAAGSGGTAGRGVGGEGSASTSAASTQQEQQQQRQRKGGQDTPEYRVEGNFLVDKFGNIDLKAGDEEVDIKFASSAEWDPTPLLKVLYDSPKPEQTGGESGDGAEGTARTSVLGGAGEVRIEGYLEKLPKGANRKSVLKRWNRRYFKARDGELFYYDEDKSQRAAGFIRLRGSEIRFKGGNLLEIFDPRKKINMVLRASSTRELEDWKLALDAEATTLRRRAPKSESKLKELRNTLIFDIGGASVRAGYAETGLAWPSLYMPTCVAVNKNTSARVCGIEALHPGVRSVSKLHYPLRSADSFADATNVELLEGLYGDLFDRLSVDPADRTVILTEPQFMTKRDRVRIAEVLMETYGIPSLYMKHQGLLSMYSYGATTGVVVDVGERCDVIPLDSGYMIERGTTKLKHGGGEVTEQLSRMMSEQGHRFFSPVERYIGRLVKERVAYVARDYDGAVEDEEQGRLHAGLVDARRFAVPDGSKTFELTGPRFRCTEGLFQPNLWGKDVPGLHTLVERAIMASSIDMRKTLSRNIYLSGGTTMLPGLAERLETELQYTLPAACAVKVHASPHRHHAAFQGASVLAGLPNFSSLCVWNEDWQEVGPDVLGKFDEDNVAPSYDYSDDDDDYDDGATSLSSRGGGARFMPAGTVRVTLSSDDNNDDDDDDDDDDHDAHSDSEDEPTGGSGGVAGVRRAFTASTSGPTESDHDDDNDAGLVPDEQEFDEPEEMQSYI